MSFQIALSGINAINDQLDAISNNIANTGTTGFKSSRANFAAMYAGESPNGVETGSITQSLDVGGGRVNTGRNLDVAIQGRGYFIARDSSGVNNYTRAGIMDVDKAGYVVDHFGRNIQGYGVVPGSTSLGPLGSLRVPNGQIAAQASSLLTYGGNLSADWQVPVVAPFNATDPQSYNSSIVSVVYDSLGAQHTVTQYFVKTGVNQIDVHSGFDGAAVPTVTSLGFATSGLLTTPVGSTPIALPAVPGANALAVSI
ncbi:MAG TPA: flagellar hook-basal body complex protein, partial [Rhizobacter sp.]|nr:flagellar hook-basal body complex protein [Rhizobacter sp.]